jgi:DNA-binding NarL/FixJ family response regulator
MHVRTVIVDDSRRFTEAARLLLERDGLAVVGTASTGSDAMDLVEALSPDLVILDIDLGTESGFDVARGLASSRARTAAPDRPEIIMVSMHAEEDFADLIEESPVAGFLAKSHLSGEAIRELLRRNATSE